MMAPLSITDPYVTVEESAFVARFLLDRERDTEKTVANVDALVDLPDGSRWALTVLTVDEVRRLLAEWKATGEIANGSYFLGGRPSDRRGTWSRSDDQCDPGISSAAVR
jgi:hypothetical protein